MIISIINKGFHRLIMRKYALVPQQHREFPTLFHIRFLLPPNAAINLSPRNHVYFNRQVYLKFNLSFHTHDTHSHFLHCLQTINKKVSRSSPGPLYQDQRKMAEGQFLFSNISPGFYQRRQSENSGRTQKQAEPLRSPSTWYGAVGRVEARSVFVFAHNPLVFENNTRKFTLSPITSVFSVSSVAKNMTPGSGSPLPAFLQVNHVTQAFREKIGFPVIPTTGIPGIMRHPPKTQEIHQKEPFFPGPSITSKRKISTFPGNLEKGEAAGAFRHPGPVSSSSLSYFRPIKTPTPSKEPSLLAADNDVKKTVPAKDLIDKIQEENVSMISGHPGISRQQDIDLHQLTDQVYRLLERKIKIEKEMRGW